MIEISDRELIDRALSGNRNAYAAILNRYKGMVFSLAFKILQNRESAEEIAQDSFLKAFRALPNFKFESKFSSWLYRIVYTTCMTHLRKKSILTEELNETHSEIPESQGENFDLQLDRKIKKAWIEKALSQIPQEDSHILYLYYFLDLSLKEMGLILDTPEENLKVRLFRARKRLKQQLEPFQQNLVLE